MAITREKFRDWKQNEITQAMMETMRVNLEDYIATMIRRITPNDAEDQFIRAYARITDSVLSWEPEFPEIVATEEVEQ